MSTTPTPPPADEVARMKREHNIHWHKRGGWARKFPGDKDRTYFGRIPAAEAVRANVAEELRRERGEPEAIDLPSITVRDAVNLFLAAMDRDHAGGKISDGQRASYGQELHFLTTATVGNAKGEPVVVGSHRRLSAFCQLNAPDVIFRPLREAAMARGLFAAEKSIIQIRRFFDWCSKTRRLMPPAFFADAFDAPGEKEKRTSKKAGRREKGVAHWTPAEVRELVDAAKATDLHRYAQVLLTLNSGMGAADLAVLEDADVDWKRGCIVTERSKTLVDRVVPLWGITADAMKASRAARPAPAKPEWASRFFLTKRGHPLVEQMGLSEKRRTYRRTDSLKNWFYRMLNADERKHWKSPAIRLHHLKRHRAGYYTLRAVFAGLARGHPGDPNLDAIIMGQKLDRAILEHYLRGGLDEKLRVVVEHVRSQLSL